MRCQHLQSLLGGARDPIIHFHKRRRRHFRVVQPAAEHLHILNLSWPTGSVCAAEERRIITAACGAVDKTHCTAFKFQVSTWGSSAKQRRILVMIALVGPTRGTPSPSTHSAHTTPPHPSVHPPTKSQESAGPTHNCRTSQISPPIQKFGDHLEANLAPSPSHSLQLDRTDKQLETFPASPFSLNCVFFCLAERVDAVFG